VFVFLSKLLPLFIYPLGLSIVLLVIALVWRRVWRPLVLLAAVLLLLGSNRCVAYSLIRSLETRYSPAPGEATAGAIVVLGGGTRSADHPRPIVEVNEAGDRLLYAAELYRRGAASHILVSGGAIDYLTAEGIAPEGSDMALFLQAQGVPKEAIWVEDRSRNTYENALYSRALLDAQGVGDVLLVTSAMHMPRSVPLFEAQGLDVTAAPTDFLVSQAEWDHLWQADLAARLIYLTPDAEYLAYTQRVLKEYVGILVYTLRGWMADPST
jgi:uncharacterized SAM-binding protein YcdF (DUF218 family)